MLFMAMTKVFSSVFFPFSQFLFWLFTVSYKYGGNSAKKKWVLRVVARNTLFSLEFPKYCTFYDFRAQMWDIAVWSKTHKNSVRGETGVLLSFSRDIDLQWSNFCHKKISNLFPLLFLQLFSELLLSWTQKDWG